MTSNTATWPRNPWTFLSGIMTLENPMTTLVSDELEGSALWGRGLGIITGI